jgi:hypothetical protein
MQIFTLVQQAPWNMQQLEHKHMISILPTAMDAPQFFVYTGSTWCRILHGTLILHGISFSLKSSTKRIWSLTTLPSHTEHFRFIALERHLLSCPVSVWYYYHSKNVSAPILTHSTTQIKHMTVESSLQVPWWANQAIVSHVIKKTQTSKIIMFSLVM